MKSARKNDQVTPQAVDYIEKIDRPDAPAPDRFYALQLVVSDTRSERALRHIPVGARRLFLALP